MSSEPLVDASEGVTKGLLNWTKDQVTELVSKLNNRELGFINDKETIQNIKDERKSPEWELYRQYILDKDLRMMVQLGLALRKIEKDKPRLHNLRDKIVKKFGVRDLHVAQFIENDLLSKLFGSVIVHGNSKIDIIKRIAEILTDIDKYVEFVKEDEDVPAKVNELKIRICAHMPSSFIVTGQGIAVPKAKEIKTRLEKELRNYSVEMTENKNKFLCIFNKNIKNNL